MSRMHRQHASFSAILLAALQCGIITIVGLGNAYCSTRWQSYAQCYLLPLLLLGDVLTVQTTNCREIQAHCGSGHTHLANTRQVMQLAQCRNSTLRLCAVPLPLTLPCSTRWVQCLVIT